MKIPVAEGKPNAIGANITNKFTETTVSPAVNLSYQTKDKKLNVGASYQANIDSTQSLDQTSSTLKANVGYKIAPGLSANAKTEHTNKPGDGNASTETEYNVKMPLGNDSSLSIGRKHQTTGSETTDSTLATATYKKTSLATEFTDNGKNQTIRLTQQDLINNDLSVFTEYKRVGDNETRVFIGVTNRD